MCLRDYIVVYIIIIFIISKKKRVCVFFRFFNVFLTH